MNVKRAVVSVSDASRTITKAQNFPKVVEQVDADWPTVYTKSSKCSFIVGIWKPSQIPKCTLESRDAMESWPYSGLWLDSLTVIPPAENYPDTVSLFSKNILTASRTASAILSLHSQAKGVEWEGGKVRSRSSHVSTALFRSGFPPASLSSLLRNTVSLTRKEKKPIGRTDQLNAYWCAPS